MANLMRKTKDELLELAKKLKLKVSDEQTKADLVSQIEAAGEGSSKKEKNRPVNWRAVERQKKQEKERSALEARLKKRGSYPGSPH